MMSKAKCFVVRKPSTGEVIATSANQIVWLKFHKDTKYCNIYSLDPPFLLGVGLGIRLQRTLLLRKDHIEISVT